MSLVIRKYNIGGGLDRNADNKPLEIYGKYYDPATFVDEIMLAATMKIRNSKMNQEEARAFMQALSHDLSLIVSGQATFGEDRVSITNQVGESNDGIIRLGRWYKGLSDEEKQNNASVMATTHILDMVNGNYITTWSEPQRYSINSEALIKNAYTDTNQWLALDTQDNTGKRGITQRYKRLAELYNAEADKLANNIKYRRGFSYTDSDLSDWANRYTNTVNLLRTAASKYQDGSLTLNEIEWLNSNGFTNGALSSLLSLDTKEYLAYLADERAKQQQLLQEEQLRLSTNYINPHLPWDVKNLSGVFNGEDFTYNDFDVGSLDSVALEAWNTMISDYVNGNGIYNIPENTQGDDLLNWAKTKGYLYVLNLTDNFSNNVPVVLFKKDLNDVGSMFILKDEKWYVITKPTLTKSGYTTTYGNNNTPINLGTFDLNKTPTNYFGSELDGTDSNWESEITNFGDLTLNNINDWESIWLSAAEHKENSGLQLLGLIRALNNIKNPLKYQNINLWGWKQNALGIWFFYMMNPTLRKTIWILAPKDNINSSSVYDKLGNVIIQRAGGVLSYRVGGPTKQSPSPDVIEEPGDVPQQSKPSIRTPNASLSSEANLLEEYETLQELTGSDYVRLGASLTDLASVGAAFVPGLNIASAVAGAGASTGEFLSDMWDLMSGRENAQGFWSSVGEYVTNLGMDAVSLLPTGKLVKAGSILKGFIKYVPHIAGIVQTTNLITDPNLRQSMMVTLGKLNKGNISALNTQDFRNIAYLGSTFLGLKGGIKSLKRPAKTGNVEVEYSLPGSSSDKRKAIISKTLTGKEEIQKEIAAQLNRGRAEGEDLIKPDDIQITTTGPLSRVKRTSVRESSEDTFRQVGQGNSGVFRDRDGLDWWFSDANLAGPGTRIGRMYGVPDPAPTSPTPAPTSPTPAPTSPTPAPTATVNTVNSPATVIAPLPIEVAPRVSLPGYSGALRRTATLVPIALTALPLGAPRRITMGTPVPPVSVLPGNATRTISVLPAQPTISRPAIPAETQWENVAMIAALRNAQIFRGNKTKLRVPAALKVLNDARDLYKRYAGSSDATMSPQAIADLKATLKDRYRLTDAQVASLKKHGGILSPKDELVFKAFEAFKKGGRVKKYLEPSGGISNVNYPLGTNQWNYGEIWGLFDANGELNEESVMWKAISDNDSAEGFNLLQDSWKHNIWRNGGNATTFDNNIIYKSEDTDDTSTVRYLNSFNKILDLNSRLDKYFGMSPSDSNNSDHADGYIGRATWARNYGLNLSEALVNAINSALKEAGKNWRIKLEKLNDNWQLARAYEVNDLGEEVNISDQVDAVADKVISDGQSYDGDGDGDDDKPVGTEYASTTPKKESSRFEVDEIGLLSTIELLRGLRGVNELRDILRNELPATIDPSRKDRAVHDAALQVALTKNDAGNLLAAASVASSGNPRLALQTKLAALGSVQTALDKVNALNYNTYLTSSDAAQEAADYNLALLVAAGNANNTAYVAMHNRQLGLDSQSSALKTQLWNNYLAERREHLNTVEDAVRSREATALAMEHDVRKKAELYRIRVPYIEKARAWNDKLGDDKKEYKTDKELLQAYFSQNETEFNNYLKEAQSVEIRSIRDHTADWNRLYSPSYGPLRYTPGYQYWEDPYGYRTYIPTDTSNPDIYKKGGSLSARDKLMLEEKKQWAKTVQQTSKENAKTIRENNKEFHKTYRSLSAGTLYLLKKAMGD